MGKRGALLCVFCVSCSNAVRFLSVFWIISMNNPIL